MNQKNMNQKNMNQKESSETTRKTMFQQKNIKNGKKSSTFQFAAYFKMRNGQHSSTDFLEWFIGFFEAEGSFSHWFDGKKWRCQIEITQKDPKLMYKIKKNFGFGHTTFFRRNVTTYWRYQVGKKDHLQALIFLCNGNLVTDHKFQSFKTFVNQFYKCYNEKPIQILEKNQKNISLDTYWLSGFLEGDAGFWAAQKKNSKQIKLSTGLLIKFYVTQKNELVLLNQIRNVFEISTKIYQLNNGDSTMLYNRLETSNLNSLKIIRNYLEIHPFLGQRNVLVKRWIRLLEYKEKDYPLTEKSSQKLRRLVLSTKSNLLKS
jgi:hypothetical protein